jgi:GNAT superfamily N-acetyltransferase
MDYPIRAAGLDDKAELARLFTVLGHPCSASDIAARWDAWRAEGTVALVADRGDGTLAGVATVQSMRVLHKALPIGRVTALVVDTHLHGKGIGRALMRAAEALVTEQGCGSMEITSHVERLQAHAFYQGIGYVQTSVRLNKVMPGALPHYGIKR